MLKSKKGGHTEPNEESAHAKGQSRKEADAEHLKARLAESERKAKELEERLMRLAAEFENYKKRAARESEQMKEASSADSMLKLLPIVDEFEIAMSHMDNAGEKEFKHGVELIYSKLLDMLKREGVERMDCMGASFDPYKHEALRQGTGEEGKVVEEIVRGYTLRGKILRHAKVVVGSGLEGDEDGKK